MLASHLSNWLQAGVFFKKLGIHARYSLFKQVLATTHFRDRSWFKKKEKKVAIINDSCFGVFLNQEICKKKIYIPNVGDIEYITNDLWVRAYLTSAWSIGRQCFEHFFHVWYVRLFEQVSYIAGRFFSEISLHCANMFKIAPKGDTDYHF